MEKWTVMNIVHDVFQEYGGGDMESKSLRSHNKKNGGFTSASVQFQIGLLWWLNQSQLSWYNHSRRDWCQEK